MPYRVNYAILAPITPRPPMQRTPKKRITLAVLCALPFASQAQEGATPEGIELKPERSLLSLPAGRDESVPVFIEADRMRGYTEEEAEGEGNVQLRRSGQSVFADRLRFETQKQEVEATGNVRLEQRGDTLEGDYLRFNRLSVPGAPARSWS